LRKRAHKRCVRDARGENINEKTCLCLSGKRRKLNNRSTLCFFFFNPRAKPAKGSAPLSPTVSYSTPPGRRSGLHFKMTILVVGGGGREHAIVWALAQSADKVVIAPGNGATHGTMGSCAIESASASSVEEIVSLSKSLRPEMVVVGPEAPLADGLAGAWSSLDVRP
jgi:hypothetical protein